MRKQLKSVLLLMGVSLIFFLGCKKEDRLVSANPEAQLNGSGKPGAVTIEWIYTGQMASGTYTGTATAHGGIEASGTTTMDAKEFGNVAHCSQTLVTATGTLTILSNCQYSTNTGTWRIVSGTGEYANLDGNGKLLMTFPAGVIVNESFTGKIREKN